MYQLKATLRHSRPPIWRLFHIPAAFSLLQLHRVLQTIMGWKDRQPHQFIVQGKFYGIPGSDNMYEVMDESKAKLFDAIGRNNIHLFRYQYNPNDNWELNIQVEKLLKAGEGQQRYPVCLAGSGAAPQEDAGESHFYLKMLLALQNPHDPSNQGFLNSKTTATSKKFDIRTINRRLAGW